MTAPDRVQLFHKRRTIFTFQQGQHLVERRPGNRFPLSLTMKGPVSTDKADHRQPRIDHLRRLVGELISPAGHHGHFHALIQTTPDLLAAQRADFLFSIEQRSVQIQTNHSDRTGTDRLLP